MHGGTTTGNVVSGALSKLSEPREDVLTPVQKTRRNREAG